MAVSFHKMHGLGNDFIVLDLRDQTFNIDREIARNLANRHTGIGCDQILILQKPTSDEQLASFDIFNSDGSKAEQCGNGMRCLGLYLKKFSQTPDGPFVLGGIAGNVTIECRDDGLVRVEMGVPNFEPDAVPILQEAVDDWYTLSLGDIDVSLGAVSMGNPHSLVVVDDLDATDITKLGKAINAHPDFPAGTNAGFAEIIDRDNIRLRVYERGAAETLACGSGACAAVSILRAHDLVNQTVNVTQAGGSLIIDWTGEGNPVMMTGPATQVFKGKF